MYYSKYKAVKTIIQGIKFDSKKEAMRYLQLKDLEQKHKIRGLQLQPKFILQEGFTNIHTGKKEREIAYIADFMYTENGVMIVEDVKGIKTADYQIKRKLFIQKYQDSYKHLET